MDGLQRQINEKNKINQIEAEANKRYEEQTEQMQKIVHAQELEEQKQKRVLQSDLNYYRCKFQKPDERREFDLNDPLMLRKSEPVRIADDDFSLGISSAQIFVGEDLGNAERKRRQREQQRAWLDQQLKEKQQAIESRQQAEKVLNESIASQEKRLEDVAAMQKKVRNQIIVSTRQFNCEMAKRKQQEKQLKQRETKEDDLAEIYNMLTSDMLCENPNVANSCTHPNKKIAFQYRGMTPAELQQFRRDQHQQMLENNKKKTEQQVMDKQWEQYALNMDRELKIKDLEMEKKRQSEFEKFRTTNKLLARKQREQKMLNDKIMNRNEVSDIFYEQFNRTTR